MHASKTRAPQVGNVSLSAIFLPNSLLFFQSSLAAVGFLNVSNLVGSPPSRRSLCLLVVFRTGLLWQLWLLCLFLCLFGLVGPLVGRSFRCLGLMSVRLQVWLLGCWLMILWLLRVVFLLRLGFLEIFARKGGYRTVQHTHILESDST